MRKRMFSHKMSKHVPVPLLVLLVLAKWSVFVYNLHAGKIHQRFSILFRLARAIETSALAVI